MAANTPMPYLTGEREPAGRRGDGIVQRLADDEQGGRGVGRISASPTRFRCCRHIACPTRCSRFAESASERGIASDHRRRGRSRPPAGNAGGEDHRPGARRAGADPPPRRAGLAVLDRADAGRDPGRDLRHRRGRGHQRRAVRRRAAGRGRRRVDAARSTPTAASATTTPRRPCSRRNEPGRPR